MELENPGIIWHLKAHLTLMGRDTFHYPGCSNGQGHLQGWNPQGWNPQGQNQQPLRAKKKKKKITDNTFTLTHHNLLNYCEEKPALLTTHTHTEPGGALPEALLGGGSSRKGWEIDRSEGTAGMSLLGLSSPAQQFLGQGQHHQQLFPSQEKPLDL